MATEAPDPRSFKTWEDAFQYPIPVVRKLEQQLRSNASENREKLRSLVGASYRDLLDTAETIIDMEARMQKVEGNLSRVGQNCNSRTLERIARNTVQARAQERGRDAERYTFSSQLAVLRSCPAVMARLIKSGGSYLLMAKVLVVGRLLHKALSQAKSRVPPIVDQLRDKLGALRRKLLRGIDKRLASSVGDLEALVESMCAYSLATSSTPTDVLRHFHHIRMEEIIGLLEHRDGLKEHGTKALQLCIQTCQDTQAIFPRRLADALAKLKAQSLVQDPDVRALYELNLDVHDRWIGEEARNYTPWPRHDELQRPEAEKLLHQWSKQAISEFLKGIRDALGDTQDLKEVAGLRQELIETWILSGSRMSGIKVANVLDDLRETMNQHLESIVQSRSQGLKTVVDAINSTLSTWQDPSKDISLWSTTNAFNDLSNGAANFKQKILNTHQGRDDAVMSIISTYNEWMSSVLQVKGIVKSMKETRWDDPFADDVDLEESDDEYGEESKQRLLSDDDPRLLEEVTQGALNNALSLFGKSFSKIIERLTSEETGDESNVSKAVFLLRVVREISDRIQQLRLQDKAMPPASPFTTNILRPLHIALASHIVRPTVQSYQKHLGSANKRRSKSHILWEGNPALPAQPSPSAFRLLQTLVQEMASCGSDLWVREAALVLKSLAKEEVDRVWKNGLDIIQQPSARNDESAKEGPNTPLDTENDAVEAKSTSEGLEEAKPSEPMTHDAALRSEQLKQLLFDILYIQRFLSTAASLQSDSDDGLVKDVGEAAEIDENMKLRLKKSASDHARKTYLLFALLA
jgi:hypothetical protein